MPHLTPANHADSLAPEDAPPNETEQDATEISATIGGALRVRSESAGATMRRRRQRDIATERHLLEQLRLALPARPDGAELVAKADLLEQCARVIQTLMDRATYLSMELAFVSHDATRRWVRECAGDGRRTLLHTVSAVMKLFAARTHWRYGEWWILDECEVHPQAGAAQYGEMEGSKPAGVQDDPGVVHGCVVRDSASVMKLAWTLVQRQTNGGFADAASDDDERSDEETKLTQFARASEKFEFRPRVGMPGRVWTSRRAEWLMDLKDRETFKRSPLAEAFGMQTCLAVPLQFGGHVHSVMSFYSRQIRPYDPEVYDLACVLSKSIADVYASSATPWHMEGEGAPVL